MTKEIQILFQLEKLYGKVMTLEQALEAMGRVVSVVDVLNDEGHEYDIVELINQTGDEVINEDQLGSPNIKSYIKLNKINMTLTPIQKLREDIKSTDTVIYLRVLTMLVEAEEQERLFLEKVFNDGLSITEFKEYYKQFGTPKQDSYIKVY